jgi:hypothetical protein
MYSVVKNVCVVDGEVVVVTVRGVSAEVKITGDKPRDVGVWLMSGERLKEHNFFGPITRGIDVCKPNRRTVSDKDEIQGEEVASGGLVDESEHILVPGGKEPARGTRRIDGSEIPNGKGEKRGGFGWGQGGKFRLLKRKEFWFGDSEIRIDAAALVDVP